MWRSSLLSCRHRFFNHVPWPARVPAGLTEGNAAPSRQVIAEASADRPLFHPTPLQKILLDEGVLGPSCPASQSEPASKVISPPDLSAKGPPR
jgi:hypothetical protein